MAARVAGNQTVARNQMTLPAASNATMSCTRKSRPMGAREKAATPRGVSGCQAEGRGRSSGFDAEMSDDGLDTSFDICRDHFV
jgi:hypothetical protein